MDPRRWEEYEDQQQRQYEQDETKGSSSKDSSFEVVDTPLPKGSKIDSKTGSPIKRKVEDEKSAEEINLTATVKMLIDSRRDTLKLLVEEKIKGNGLHTEDEKVGC